MRTIHDLTSEPRGYGLSLWPARLAPIPQAHEQNIIARVQSMRTRNGRRAEPLSFEASVTYLRNVERVRKHGVTVPQPLRAGTPAGAVHTAPDRAQTSGNLHAGSRSDSASQPPPVAAARAGAFPIDHRDLPDMSPEQWDEWESAIPF